MGIVGLKSEAENLEQHRDVQRTLQFGEKVEEFGPIGDIADQSSRLETEGGGVIGLRNNGVGAHVGMACLPQIKICFTYGKIRASPRVLQNRRPRRHEAAEICRYGSPTSQLTRETLIQPDWEISRRCREGFFGGFSDYPIIRPLATRRCNQISIMSINNSPVWTLTNGHH